MYYKDLFVQGCIGVCYKDLCLGMSVYYKDLYVQGCIGVYYKDLYVQGCIGSLELSGEYIDPIKSAVLPSTHVKEGCEGQF